MPAPREAWEAYRDGDGADPRRHRGIALALAGSAGVWLTAHVLRSRRVQPPAPRHVIPSAADIHVRPPPPR